jgi:hypothetical protein
MVANPRVAAKTASDSAEAGTNRAKVRMKSVSWALSSWREKTSASGVQAPGDHDQEHEVEQPGGDGPGQVEGSAPGQRGQVLPGGVVRRHGWH